MTIIYKRANNFKNLENEKFGKLLVTSNYKTVIQKGTSSRRVHWLCQCDCGSSPRYISGTSLRAGNATSCGCNRKLEYGKAAFNALYSKYKRRAISERNLNFLLSENEFEFLTSQSCYYCGVKPYQKYSSSNNGDYIYNGIDRLNPQIGYEINNCVTACGDCNFAKQSLTHDEFLNLVERIYNHKIKDKN